MDQKAMEKVKNEIEILRNRLNQANRAYYVDAKPIMDDQEYDRLFDQLQQLEEKYPQFYDDTSPTVRIGSDIDQSLPEKPHTIPVLSLDKCYQVNELMDWITKNEKKLDQELALTIEPKIDGSGVVLYYNQGKLISALTRGNGYFGNDITENIKTIHSIPLKIDYKGELAVRGEVYMSKKAFTEFNRKHADGAYANPRNLASGSIRRQKSKETALFPLNIFLYDSYFKENVFDNHLDNLIFLKKLGFPLNDYLAYFSTQIKEAHTIPFKNCVTGLKSDIQAYLQEWGSRRENLDYEIDGLVIKINALDQREKLGFTSHHPRWAIAFKFEAPSAQTMILSIDTQVGRGGRITPVANLKPAHLSGSTITRATLHNQDYMDALGVNLGDQVSISKRGDVIPAVEEVLEKGEFASAYQLEQQCPSCRSELIKEGAHLFCPNEECPKRLLGTLQHFVSKNQMDIVSLGNRTLDFLFRKNHIRYIYDIYQFDYQTLLQYEGFKEKKIANIINAVNQSKEKEYPTVLSSLGLKDIGSKVSELLTAIYQDMDQLITAAARGESEQFSHIDGIGESIANSIMHHFTNPATLHLIKQLKKAGLKFQNQASKAPPVESQFLAGTKWVVSGSFEQFKPRDKAKELIKSYGGQIMAAISSKTDFLLCGQDAGSKLEKARTLAIKIIDEQTFLAMLNDQSIKFDIQADHS